LRNKIIYITSINLNNNIPLFLFTELVHLTSKFPFAIQPLLVSYIKKLILKYIVGPKMIELDLTTTSCIVYYTVNL